MLLGFIAARGGANDLAKVMDHFRLLFGTGTPRQDHRASYRQSPGRHRNKLLCRCEPGTDRLASLPNLKTSTGTSCPASSMRNVPFMTVTQSPTLRCGPAKTR